MVIYFDTHFTHLQLNILNDICLYIVLANFANQKFLKSNDTMCWQWCTTPGWTHELRFLRKPQRCKWRRCCDKYHRIIIWFWEKVLSSIITLDEAIYTDTWFLPNTSICCKSCTANWVIILYATYNLIVQPEKWLTSHDSMCYCNWHQKLLLQWCMLMNPKGCVLVRFSQDGTTTG